MFTDTEELYLCRRRKSDYFLPSFLMYILMQMEMEDFLNIEMLFFFCVTFFFFYKCALTWGDVPMSGWIADVWSSGDDGQARRSGSEAREGEN